MSPWSQTLKYFVSCGLYLADIITDWQAVVAVFSSVGSFKDRCYNAGYDPERCTKWEGILTTCGMAMVAIIIVRWWIAGWLWWCLCDSRHLGRKLFSCINPPLLVLWIPTGIWVDFCFIYQPIRMLMCPKCQTPTIGDYGRVDLPLSEVSANPHENWWSSQNFVNEVCENALESLPQLVVQVILVSKIPKDLQGDFAVDLKQSIAVGAFSIGMLIGKMIWYSRKAGGFIFANLSTTTEEGDVQVFFDEDNRPKVPYHRSAPPQVAPAVMPAMVPHSPTKPDSSHV